jgi:hypothetical protein
VQYIVVVTHVCASLLTTLPLLSLPVSTYHYTSLHISTVSAYIVSLPYLYHYCHTYHSFTTHHYTSLHITTSLHHYITTLVPTTRSVHVTTSRHHDITTYISAPVSVRITIRPTYHYPSEPPYHYLLTYLPTIVTHLPTHVRVHVPIYPYYYAANATSLLKCICFPYICSFD